MGQHALPIAYSLAAGCLRGTRWNFRTVDWEGGGGFHFLRLGEPCSTSAAQLVEGRFETLASFYLVTGTVFRLAND